MARLGTVAVAAVGMAAAWATPALAQRARPPVTTTTGETMTPTSTVPAAKVTVSEGANLDVIALSERWHEVPQSHRLRLSVQIVDEVTELGNLIGTGMNELSNDVLGLKFDGRRRRARLRLGTGEGEFLRFKLDSEWHFSQGKARIQATLQLGIGSHHWQVELPDMEMVPASYRGERGVEVRVPLFERKW